MQDSPIISITGMARGTVRVATADGRKYDIHARENNLQLPQLDVPVSDYVAHPVDAPVQPAQANPPVNRAVLEYWIAYAISLHGSPRDLRTRMDVQCLAVARASDALELDPLAVTLALAPVFAEAYPNA